jgi:hypothetical protein
MKGLSHGGIRGSRLAELADDHDELTPREPLCSGERRREHALRPVRHLPTVTADPNVCRPDAAASITL